MALNRREFLKVSAAGMGCALCADPAGAVQREAKQLSPDAVGCFMTPPYASAARPA